MSEVRVSVDLSYEAACALNNAARREIEIVQRRREWPSGSLDLDWNEYLRLLEEARDAIAAACGSSS